MTKRRLWYLPVVLCAVILLGTSCAQPAPTASPAPAPAASPAPKPAQVYTIRYASATPGAENIMNKSAVFFKDTLEKKTNGRIKVEVYPSGQLAENKDTVIKMQQGVVTMTAQASSWMATAAPILNFLDLPYLFNGDEDYTRFVQGPGGQKLRQALEKAGISPLEMFHIGWRSFNSRTVNIKSPEDMKGWKVRIMGTPTWIKTFESWGAQPVNMSAGEVLSALQNKVIDGFEWPWTLAVTQEGYLDVLKHFTEGKHSLANFGYYISKPFMDSLPADLQQAVRDSAREMLAFNNAGLRKDWSQAESVAKSKGVTVYYLTPQEIQKFRDKIAPIYDQSKAEYGDLLDLVAAARK